MYLTAADTYESATLGNIVLWCHNKDPRWDQWKLSAFQKHISDMLFLQCNVTRAM